MSQKLISTMLSGKVVYSDKALATIHFKINAESGLQPGQSAFDL